MKFRIIHEFQFMDDHPRIGYSWMIEFWWMEWSVGHVDCFPSVFIPFLEGFQPEISALMLFSSTQLGDSPANHPRIPNSWMKKSKNAKMRVGR